MLDEKGFIKPAPEEEQYFDISNTGAGTAPPKPIPEVQKNNDNFLLPPPPPSTAPPPTVQPSNSGRGLLAGGLIIGLLLGGILGGIFGSYLVLPNPGTFPWAQRAVATDPGVMTDTGPTVVVSEEQAIEEAIKLAAPAVVQINIISASQNPTDSSAVPQEVLGSGFLVTADGYILTNNHVVTGATKISVILKDGREFSAQVVGTDPISDVAVIKIEGTNLPSVQMGDSALLTVGQEVIAIGNPYGLGQTVTTGVVSALARDVSVSATENLVGVVQTDAAINPGNSGGPLIDLNGRVVGMNTMLYQGSQGLGFSVSINTAKKVYAAILKTGKITWAMLGIQGATLTQALAQQYNVKVLQGVYVAKVIVGSGAEVAGLEIGDIITTINGQVMPTIDDVLSYIRAKNVGDTVQVVVDRKGTTKTFSVVLKALSQ